jgi:hypothetical protein
LQQIQYIAVKDLKGTRAYRRLLDAHKKGVQPPELTTRLSKEHDDRRPPPNWNDSWEETMVPVERVIAYWSRILASAETRYSATEREALAAKESLVRFQPFIEGEKILLVTDHAALTWAKTYENANRRLAAWGLVFAAFPNLVITHRPGRVHSNVDPLSRLPRIPSFISPAREDLPSSSASTEHEDLQLAWQTFIQERELALDSHVAMRRVSRETATERTGSLESSPDERSPAAQRHLHVHVDERALKDFALGYASDKAFAPLIKRANEERPDPQKHRAYRLASSGLLYFEDADGNVRLCVPASQQTSLIKEVHDEAHETAHAGGERTLASLRERFYWPTMRADVNNYVRTCDPCQKTKHSRAKTPGFLQPLAIPAVPFDTISLDFITGLPDASGKDAILVVVDKFTKFATFIATRTDISASETAALLFQKLVKLFGLPRVIIGDRDPRWTSSVWSELARLFKTRLALSTSRHPQTDGQTEVMNQHLEVMLRAYIQADLKSWASWLDVLQFAYNNAPHSSHGSSPAQLLFGFKPRTPLDFLADKGLDALAEYPDARARLKDLHAHRQAARDAIQKSLDKQAYFHDQGRQPARLQVGDEVLLNPHTLELVDVKGPSRKLIQRRIGPFEITEVVSPTAFRLRLPDSYPMHNVVNIQHLTKYHSNQDVTRPRLANPRDHLLSTKEYEVEKIVGERKRKGKSQYRVKWKGYDAEHDTWQLARDLRNAPDLLRDWKLRL